MSKQPVKSYDAEFKPRAVKLAVKSDSQAQVARNLGIRIGVKYHDRGQDRGQVSYFLL
jgi:transposase-like protein